MSFCRYVCRKTLRCCLRVPGCKLVCYTCLLPICFGDDDSDTEEKDDEGYFSCAAPPLSESYSSAHEVNPGENDSVEYYNDIEVHCPRGNPSVRLLSNASEADIPDTSTEGDTTFFSARGEQYYANIDSPVITHSDNTVVYHNVAETLPRATTVGQTPSTGAHQMKSEADITSTEKPISSYQMNSKQDGDSTTAEQIPSSGTHLMNSKTDITTTEKPISSLGSHQMNSKQVDNSTTAEQIPSCGRHEMNCSQINNFTTVEETPSAEAHQMNSEQTDNLTTAERISSPESHKTNSKQMNNLTTEEQIPSSGTHKMGVKQIDLTDISYIDVDEIKDIVNGCAENT